MAMLIHRHKSNKIKIGMNEMTVIISEICVRSKNEAWLIYGDINPEIA